MGLGGAIAVLGAIGIVGAVLVVTQSKKAEAEPEPLPPAKPRDYSTQQGMTLIW